MEQGDLVQERYRLDAALGRGGMAEVWRAIDERLERPVAIKFLAPQFKEDPEFLVRFFAEAQSVARISHPNVVAVLDFGEFEDNPYLVMEYVPGGAVNELTGTPVAPEKAFRIVRDAALGAGAAHALGIVHRDIKPGNILLDDSGMGKIADFGIALTAVSEKLTATGQVIGSPHYIAPEQAAGRGARAESDVYALGVVLYELLTGKPPFDADNATAIAIAHVDQEPEPPSARVEGIAPEIDALVLRTLAKKPAARYRNGDQLAAALEETMPSLEPAVMGAVAISDATEAVAGGAVAGTAVAGTAVADEITSENAEVAVSPAPSRGRKVAWLAAVFVLLAILAGAAVWASMRDEDEPTKAPVAGEGPNVPKKHKPTASPTETSELDDAVPVASTPTPTTTEADTSGSGGTGGSGGSGSGGSGGTGGSGSGGSGGGGGGGGSGGGGGQTSPPPQSPTPEPTTTPEPTPSG